MTALPLSIFFIIGSFLVWAVFVRKIYPIILLFPVAIDSYSLIFPGLMWKDIALIFWILLAIIFVRKVGALTSFAGILLFIQLSINFGMLILGKFHGGFLNAIITPLHMYLPILILVALIENNTYCVEIIWDKYAQIIFWWTLILCVTILLSFGSVANAKQIPGVAASAGFLAVVHAYWLVSVKKSKSVLYNLWISTLSLTFILVSDTRGALVNFIILSFVVICIKSELGIRRVLPYGLLSLLLIIATLFFPPNLYLPDSVMSIFNLYAGLFVPGADLVDATNTILSGDRVRMMLWGHAFDVWSNNFWFGIGSNQFDSSTLFSDRDERLSPHHAILSVAVDGGIVALIASFLPQLYIIRKTMFIESTLGRMLFHLSWVHIAMAFVFGYSFGFVMIVLLYQYWRGKKL